jgi:acetoin utilization deacetylase AcuC-like enzyme
MYVRGVSVQNQHSCHLLHSGDEKGQSELGFLRAPWDDSTVAPFHNPISQLLQPHQSKRAEEVNHLAITQSIHTTPQLARKKQQASLKISIRSSSNQRAEEAAIRAIMPIPMMSTTTSSSTVEGGTATGNAPVTMIDPVYLLYDERMLWHRPLGWEEPMIYPKHRDEVDDSYPVENPERLRAIHDRLLQLNHRLMYDEDDILITGSNSTSGNRTGAFEPVTCRLATQEEILLAHTAAYYDRLDQLQFYTDGQLAAGTVHTSNAAENDIYYCRETFTAARLAAGGLLNCIDRICRAPKQEHMMTPTNNNKAVALVRPPGHHACQEQEMGFCFVNSVVVAAKYALQKFSDRIQRVCILDWDIHDGNATAEDTLQNDNIFRIDLHRYNPKYGFYPYTGPPSETGTGSAKGLNLNMCWTQGGMRNAEYAASLYELILPLLAEYKPDLLIISCGLDAAMGDILGGIYAI